MKFVDSHAHVYLPEFEKDQSEVLDRAMQSGVSRIVMPNIDHTSIDSMLEMEDRYPEQCYATIGLHPCSVKTDFEKELYLVEQWLGKRKFKAIGETGIDLYWDKTFLEQQIESLKIQIEWAKQFDLPIILHCRDSFEETIEIIESQNDHRLKGVFHCFTGTVKDAERIERLENFYLGIGGVATFKNGGMDKVLPEIHMEKVLLETDSPYLAPVPYRGKRNESSYIPLIAEKISSLTGKDLEDIAIQTSASSENLFNI